MHRPLALAVTVGVLFASPSPPAIAAAPPSDVLTIYSGGLDELLVDPKDQGLKEVLRLLPRRVLDLPEEVDDDTIPAPLLSFLADALMRPMFVRFGTHFPGEGMGGPPIAAQLDLLTDDLDEAQATAEHVQGLLAPVLPGAGEMAPAWPSLTVHDLDGAPLLMGPMRIGRRPAFTMAVNDVSDAAPDLGNAGLPEGVSPCFALRFDAAPLAPFIDMLAAQAGPQAGIVREQLEMMGIAGPHALTFEAACGYGRDRAHGAVRIRNYAKLLERMGATDAAPIRREDLRLIPADATLAQISCFDLGGYLDAMRSMMSDMEGHDDMDEEAMPDPIDMLAMMTGIHLRDDIVDHLGTQFGMYMSDRTGGGGLISMVFFAQVRNEQGMRDTLDRLTGMVNAMAAEHARGYVRFARRDVGGQPVTVLTFPGVPVPLEISVAVGGGYLYAAMSPQGLLAAMDQGRRGRESLADNPRFREMGGLELDGAIQVTFLDTPRTMRDGYGLVSLGMSALTNLTRSPLDPERGVFGSMPSYAELSGDARAFVEVVRVTDGDLVAQSQCDRSVLVNACGTVGVLGGSSGAVAIAAMGAGAILPAISKARDNAARVKRAAQFRNLGMAIMIFAQEHEDRVPESVDELIRGQYLEPDGLEWTGRVPVPADAGPPIWLNASLRRLNAARQPARQILAYDRAMLLAESWPVAVLFCDGHVELLDPHEVRQLMGEPQHDGVDFDGELRW